MSNVNQAAFDQAVAVLFEQLGAAAGSLIYTDGRIDIKAVQTALRESRSGITICGVSVDAYAAAREILGWGRFDGKVYKGDQSQVNLVEVEVLGNDAIPSVSFVPEGSSFYRVTLSGEGKADISFYAILGIPRTNSFSRPVPPRGVQPTIRGGRAVVKDPRGILNDLVHVDDAPAGKPGKSSRKGGGKKDRRDRDDSRYN